MAESVFKYLLRERGLTEKYRVSSAATHPDDLGSPPYYATVQKLNELHIPVADHRARLMTREDGEKWDYIVGMDEENRKSMRRILGERYFDKIYLLLDFTPSPRPIADPWYTRDFDRAYADIRTGLEALLNKLETEYIQSKIPRRFFDGGFYRGLRV